MTPPTEREKNTCSCANATANATVRYCGYCFAVNIQIIDFFALAQ